MINQAIVNNEFGAIHQIVALTDLNRETNEECNDF